MKINKHGNQNITIIHLLLAGVLLVLMLIMILWFQKSMQTYETKEETYQYKIGNILEYSSDAEIQVTKDSMIIKDQDKKAALDSSPILYKGKKKLLLPASMSINMPNYGNTTQRLNYFTTLTDEGDRILVDNGKKTITVPGGFLFDGKDLFLFLEKTTVTYGNNTYQLSPLSYVSVVYNNAIEIYDSTTGNYTWNYTGACDVMAEADGGYGINLSKDILETAAGQQLLFTDIDVLSVME